MVKPAPGESRADAAAASRARQEFGRIKNIVFTVRSVFWAGAVFALVQLLLWLVVFSSVESDGSLLESLATAFVFLQLILMPAGSLFVLRAPRLWTAVGACCWTIDTAFGWYLHDGEIDPNFVILLCKTFLLVAFWFAVAQAGRVERLMAEHPDLQLVRRRLDPSLRTTGGVADRARDARVRERQAAQMGQLRVLLFVVGGMVALGVGIWWLTRPPAFEPFALRFVAAWNGRDLPKVCALFADGGRGESTLRTDLARRGWLEALPAAETPKVDGRGDTGRVTWPVTGGAVTAMFEREERGWHLTRVELPALAPSPLPPAVDAFRAAWDGKGTEALVASFRPGSRERLGPMLVQMLKKRGWDDTRPKLGGVDPGKAHGGEASVLFALGNDELQVRFEFWHPTWYVAGIKPPRE